MRTCARISIRMYVYIYIYIHVCVCTYCCVCTYTYTDIKVLLGDSGAITASGAVGLCGLSDSLAEASDETFFT